MTREHIWDIYKDFPIIHLPNVLNNVFRKYFDLRLFFCSATVKVFMKAFPSWDNLFRDTWIHATGPHLLVFGSRISNLSFLWGRELCFVLTQSCLELGTGSRGTKSHIPNYGSFQGLSVVDWERTFSIICHDLSRADVIFKIIRVQRNKLFGIVIHGIWLKMNQKEELLNCSPLSGTKYYDN